MHSTIFQGFNILTLLSLTHISFTSANEIGNATIPMECMAICAPIAELSSICDVGATPSSNTNTTTSPTSGMNLTNAEMVKANPMAEMAAGTEGAIMMSAGAKNKKRQENMSGSGMSGMNGMSAMDMAEMMCICENKSFDVGKVMGLCASCMEQNSSDGTKTAVENVDRIMAACSFSSTSYAPSATSILESVTVQATKPVVTGSASGTGMPGMNMTGMETGAAGRVEVVTGFGAVGMVMASLGFGVGLVCGML